MASDLRIYQDILPLARTILHLGAMDGKCQHLHPYDGNRGNPILPVPSQVASRLR